MPKVEETLLDGRISEGRVETVSEDDGGKTGERRRGKVAPRMGRGGGCSGKVLGSAAVGNNEGANVECEWRIIGGRIHAYLRSIAQTSRV